MNMILILAAIIFISLIMLIAGLVENVKGVWISGLALMLLTILAGAAIMFLGVWVGM